MGNARFDDRYPEIFQAGGDSGLRSPEPSPHAGVDVSDDAGSVITDRIDPAPRDDAPVPASLSAPTDLPAALPEPAWSPRRWVPAVAAAVLMLAVAVFCITAQYWLPAAKTSNPADYHGLTMDPWGRVIFMAAPAFLAGGLGIVGALLFLASRRSAKAELACRLALGVLGVLVSAAGYVALFANFLFPEALQFGSPGDETVTPDIPWPYAIGPSGVSLLTLGLLILAVLLVVPRRWQSGGPERRATLRSGRARAAWFGAACLAGGVFSMMLPYIFPLSTASQTVELANGGTTLMSSWSNQAGILMPSLLLVGVIAVAWAVILPAVAPAADAEDDGWQAADVVEP
ncbi:hypothetical protein AL755_19405 [Arthrobacter sp. ERGS1:01]|uniref:hypothetical protein n=1 Tax=Arthrobacter sp. ERGS1:01 TaxID=1704044 RepID=UPI0006B4ABDA|nr:hypothetical protein [Arthrobacter sp. ERGS1:01]ALE07134.1 hypothetical protein AL755_19405 [Arthrobacter sp. ERGS1:01]